MKNTTTISQYIRGTTYEVTIVATTGFAQGSSAGLQDRNALEIGENYTALETIAHIAGAVVRALHQAREEAHTHENVTPGCACANPNSVLAATASQDCKSGSAIAEGSGAYNGS